MKSDMQRAKLVLLTVVHFLVDLFSSLLTPILPALVTRLQLSLTQAGLLAGLPAMTSSLVQPLMGILGDRMEKRYFIILGPVFCAVFMSAVGLAPSFLVLLLFIILGGFGTASFHPQSVSMAGDVSGSRRGYGVSLFIVGGTAGLAASPFVVPRIVERFGLESLVWLAVPTVIAVLAMARVIPIRNEDRRITRLADVGASFRPNLWPMVNLTVVGIIRTISGVGFATFFVLLLKDRGLTLQQGGDLLFVFQGGAVIGGFVGGWLSDRLGRSRVIWSTILFSTPFLFASLYDTGPMLPVWLFLGGFMNMASNSVSVAMAQELVPDSAGTASSFPMGFSWGAAGGALIVFGGIADRIGVVATLEVLALIPLAAVALALLLPPDREFRRAATRVRKAAADFERVT
ncbi:MAG: MFS transporter [Gemmatimonadetes bacterium]|nr:MFS transporter [Gemmatimonadota bacterium]MYG85621.1 MFS transporter [Gemmatimonadota bacterium]MYJ90458.1 MFS transporter [Gemmatimonadota bacterium]